MLCGMRDAEQRVAQHSAAQPTHRTSVVPTAWRFFDVPDRTWRFFLCVVAAGFSLCCGSCNRFRLPWQRLTVFFGKASGARGCFLSDVSATPGRVSVTAAWTSTMRIRACSRSGHYFYESFGSGSQFFALLRCWLRSTGNWIPGQFPHAAQFVL